MLWLVDPKFFKSESVLTHEIEPGDIGKSKALTTARRCKAISPTTRVFAFNGSAEQLHLDAFADADLVVLATDNLAAEIEVGQRCVRLAKPLVQSSVHGDTLTAQVRVLGNVDGEGPCPACAFGTVEWRMLNDQTRFSCEGFDAPQPVPGPAGPPTMSFSGLCSLSGDLGLNQILRVVLGLGTSVLDTSVEYCGFTNRAISTRIVRNANCPVDHCRCALMSTNKSLPRTSLAELSQTAALAADAGLVTFTVDGHDWIESGACHCPARSVVRRFAPIGHRRAGRCPKCRAPILAQPFSTHRTVAATLLNGALEEPLEKLGVTAVSCVLVSNGNQAVMFRESNAQPLAS